MKIAVLEWICGGGMHAIPVGDIPDSLRQEGWAMLSCLVEQLAAAGNQVVTVVDSRLNLVEASNLNSDLDRTTKLLSAIQIVNFSSLEACSHADVPIESTIAKWKQVAKECDLSIVIAPEIDGILQRCIQSMIDDGLPMINCAGEFLNIAASKLKTAMRLTEHGLPTPASISADRFDPTQLISPTGLWCVKPDLGAGCDGLQIGSAEDLRHIMGQIDSKADWIVQPWLVGEAFSCSAIVDSQGQADWLPLVTQRFQTLQTSDATTTRLYCGGELVSPQRVSPPVDLLNDAIRVLNVPESGHALGWVGVDLLLQPDGQWVIVEVNPRLTTSIIGLSKASTVNLAQRMVDGFQGKVCPRLMQSQWREVEFSPSGD